jgi:hypothetical protein
MSLKFSVGTNGTLGTSKIVTVIISQWNFCFSSEFIFFRRFYIGECRDARQCVPTTAIADQSLVPPVIHNVVPAGLEGKIDFALKNENSLIYYKKSYQKIFVDFVLKLFNF